MNDNSGNNPRKRNQLQEAIFSVLEDHGALSTNDVTSIVEDDTETVQKHLNRMAEIGQVEKRKTNNQDVWLTWKNTK